MIYQQPGIKGFSLGFNGIDSYVTVGKNGRPQDTFTFGGWIRTSLRHEIDPESAMAVGTDAGVYNQRYPFFPRFEMSGAGAGLSVGTNGISVYESGSSYLPALRDRTEDILEFVEYFLKEAAVEVGSKVTGITDAAQTILSNFDWPGNNREKAAKILGIGERTLYRKIREYNL